MCLFTSESGGGRRLLLEAEDWMDISRGDNLRLDEAEELHGMLSGVEDDDGIEVDVVAASGGCVPR